MEHQTLTCINCPMGCRLTVDVENGQVVQVTGNACARGATYARQESIAPLRMVTAVAAVAGSRIPISLKTERPIPKHKIADCMQAIRTLQLKLPIALGDVLLENAADTGVALIATKSLP